MITIGDKMPSFEVLDQDGNTVKSEDFKDHHLFLFQGQHFRVHGRGLLVPGQLCRAYGGRI